MSHMSKKELNRADIARLIAADTGYTITDILNVMASENNVIAQAIAEGYSIKNHKLFKLEIETKPEKRAYDGFRKEYFTVPEKQILKLKHLSQLEKALEELNAKPLDTES